MYVQPRPSGPPKDIINLSSRVSLLAPLLPSVLVVLAEESESRCMGVAALALLVSTTAGSGAAVGARTRGRGGVRRGCRNQPLEQNVQMCRSTSVGRITEHTWRRTAAVEEVVVSDAASGGGRGVE